MELLLNCFPLCFPLFCFPPPGTWAQNPTVREITTPAAHHTSFSLVFEVIWRPFMFMFMNLR